MDAITTGISVIMPTYNQGSFIRRAIQSLFDQTYKNWELIIINDGCTDNTTLYLEEFLTNTQIKYIENKKNKGLGYALNQGLDNASYEYIAYLPSDDYYLKDHLRIMMNKIKENSSTILVYSGFSFQSPDTIVNSFYKDTEYTRKGYCLQLVQTMHKKTEDRWLERREWVTEDLFAMFWYKLSMKGAFLPSKKISCFWTDHPRQRHKIISESHGGGLNYYRIYYSVESPIRLRVSKEKFIDEESLYKDYRSTPKISSDSALKILLVGELAYNPERIYALEEAGHKLYGLWVQRPNYSFNTVGPIPFGNIENIPFDNWEKRIHEIKPDIIYALLNFTAVPLACEVLKKTRGIPFIWHFKEGPSVCLKNGIWEDLLYLYTFADGKIYINDTAQQWYEQFIPISHRELSFILDGDLPKKECFKDLTSPKLSDSDDNIHTLIAGRVVGIHPNIWKIFIRKKIHIHVYNENYLSVRQPFFTEMKKLAPNNFHLHPHCPQDNWTLEFSKYDAAWLHCLGSSNQENILQASWDDLNIPARINTYAAAGLPMILRNNSGHTMGIQKKVTELNIGVFYEDYEDLANQLLDREKMRDLQQNVWKNRNLFCFDYYVPQLVSFFRKVINNKK